MTITEFLLARVAEDEADARAAIDPNRPGTHWRWEVPDDDVGDPDAPRWLRTAEEFPTTSGVGPLPAFPLGFESRHEPTRGMAHIARHDPARVLAECDAKRRIVRLSWHHLGDDEYGWGMEEAKQQVLALLALPYADHPDYREEWRP